jgi:tRNA threonylcarbamoyl adenosine modification protein YeaZ
MNILSLAINTASSKTSIALFDGEKILAEKSWQSKNDEAEKLMPAIDLMLKKAKKNFDNLKRIIVVKGPGSFTGLRIGVTVANTIAYLNKCELFGFDTCEYLWEAAPAKSTAKPSIALLLFAGSKGVYVSLPAGGHGQKGESAKKAKLVNLPELNQFLKDHKIKEVFGEISADQKKTLQGIKFIPTKITFAKIIQKILKKITSKKIKSVKMVVPIYVKKPAITISKKNLFA